MTNTLHNKNDGGERGSWSFRNYVGTLLLLGMMYLSVGVHAQYVHTQGTQIVDESNNPLYFRGINLGNWLLWEGYLMMGDYNFRTHTQFFNGVKDAFGGNLTQAIEFEHQWRLNYVNEQAIIDLKNQGFNSVRIPFHFNLFWDYNSSSPSNRGFQYLDQVINYCRNNGMYVLLDMHAAPGYQNPGDHSDNVNSNSSQPRNSVTFWDGNNVNIASQVWQHIANYYKNEPVVWGYDLINEPVPQAGREYELLPSLITMRNAIRQVDNNHIIVAEGSWWGSDMQKLDWQDGQVQSNSGVNSRWDNNLVYQTHHYSNDVSALNGRKSLTDRLGVPLILGEYGENSNSILREMTDWCINNNVGYFPWSFKKMYHDKCIWTINPNSGYNAVRDFIRDGGNPPNNAYNNMISFCQNNIGNGKPGITFHQDFYDAVKYTGSTSTGCTGSFLSISAAIQAEAYCDMSGIQTETTSDTGGGQNVGWTDAGDWLAYRVDIPATGNYTVEYRVASSGGGGSLQIEPFGGGAAFGSISVSSTGGWQNWMTISHTVSLNAGQQDIALAILAGGFNLNWFKITSQTSGTSAPVGQTIWLRGSHGEYVSSENGQGGMNCNRGAVGDWEKFTVVAVGSSQIALQGNNGQYVNAQNGQSAMTCNSPSISGWESFEWVDLGGNNVALLGFGDQYVSSENGQSAMMCNRGSIGGWETFTWGNVSGSRMTDELTASTEEAEKVSFVVYPNPVKGGLVNITLPQGDQETETAFVVSNLSGKVVLSGSFVGAKQQIQLPVATQPGIYMLSISGNNLTAVKKIIID
ncbi:MAG: carbohydrate-binding protein [Marinoscillum sp.]|uniref:carbohydrate-binding protein n=1 Tax=Marinoscillum sp. TaxID=2024838 RepID=UPI0032F8C87A